MSAGSRAAGLATLAALVALAHLWIAGLALPEGLGGDHGTARSVIDVSFVRELAPAEPPGAAPRAPPNPAPGIQRASHTATPPAEPASAPAVAEPVPPPPEPVRQPPPEPVPAAVATESDAATPVAAAVGPMPSDMAAIPGASGGTGTAANFEWPPSTRLLYTLSGDYRGPVEGQASVEWRRQGTRYTVDLNLSIGPSFAPLMSRSITSEGEVTPAGLHPSRYDETTRMVLRETRRVVVLMGDDEVVLAGGRTLPRPPGLQDSASQFVQLTWLFTTDPGRLREGQQIELPLALPRRLGTWVYEVGATEPVDTPAGPVPAVHLKPRRDAAVPRPSGELTAEVWFAPSLQYLPVRMLIRQDAETYVELRLAGLPQQAADAQPARAASAPRGR